MAAIAANASAVMAMRIIRRVARSASRRRRTLLPNPLTKRNHDDIVTQPARCNYGKWT
jgi:hypothetical protein